MKKIAYCPTMKPYAEALGAKINEVSMLEMSSAAQVLGALRSGSVDGVLIGRYAKKKELEEGTEREIFKEGYTLVYKTKGGISESELKDLAVKTYLGKDELGDYIPLFRKIDYFRSFKACVEDGLETPMIIDWKDFRDDFEMLIPLNKSGKLPVFRAPVLYYRDIDFSVIKRMREVLV